jgi:nuclear pore complex protein Nup155
VFRTIGRRVRNSEVIFNPSSILQLLLKFDLLYAHKVDERNDPWSSWPIDVMLDLRVPCESILAELESVWYEQAAPFNGPGRRPVTKWIVHTVERWLQESQSLGPIPFGSEDNAVSVEEFLKIVLDNWDLERGGQWEERTRVLRDRINQVLR